jgi:hypothetical protein
LVRPLELSNNDTVFHVNLTVSRKDVDGAPLYIEIPKSWIGSIFFNYNYDNIQSDYADNLLSLVPPTSLSTSSTKNVDVQTLIDKNTLVLLADSTSHYEGVCKVAPFKSVVALRTYIFDQISKDQINNTFKVVYVKSKEGAKANPISIKEAAKNGDYAAAVESAKSLGERPDMATTHLNLANGRLANIQKNPSIAIHLICTVMGEYAVAYQLGDASQKAEIVQKYNICEQLRQTAIKNKQKIDGVPISLPIQPLQ